AAGGVAASGLTTAGERAAAAAGLSTAGRRVGAAAAAGEQQRHERESKVHAWLLVQPGIFRQFTASNVDEGEEPARQAVASRRRRGRTSPRAGRATRAPS